MKEDILKLFIERGFLLDKDMLNFLSELKDEEVANEILTKIALISHEKLITKTLVDNNLEKIKPVLIDLDKDKKKIVEKFFVNISVSVEVKKETEIKEDKEEVQKEKISPVKILSPTILPAKKLEVKDFVKHFRNRYNFLKGILQQRNELEGLISIDKIFGNNRNFSIIGIVSSKRITQNKNLILEVEDLTGKVKVLINQNKEEIYEKAKEILLDDVIGFKVSGSRDFLFVNDLFYPDSFLKEKHNTSEEVYALFISDFHLGSKNFLEKNFSNFIDWLNGEGCDEKQKQVLKKIKYLFVLGDSVDGAGIYPGQEKDLKIKDITKQYEKLAEFYKRIPKYINIIQCAGQHDAVRVAVPQPAIGEDFANSLMEIENLHLVSNPSLIEIEGSEDKAGIKVLMYHGAGIIPSIINEIEELRLNKTQASPAKAVKHLLLRRHLAPTHGGFVYIPNIEEDDMLIKEVPDIITTGDLHRVDIDKYNGTLIICNSCWQTQTAFEEKVGNLPDYCKVPVVNLKTNEVKILDFEDVDEDACESMEETEKIKIEVKEDKNENRD
jgi:DNA polymerase II small subunit